MINSQQCGLLHSILMTVPSISSDLVMSNSPKEWWANTGVETDAPNQCGGETGEDAG